MVLNQNQKMLRSILNSQLRYENARLKSLVDTNEKGQFLLVNFQLMESTKAVINNIELQLQELQEIENNQSPQNYDI